MRVLLNAAKEKMEVFSRAAAPTEFAPLADGAAGDAAVALRAREFAAALNTAVGLGVPVVVVAGTPDEEGEVCAHAALEYGVPGECVLFLKDGRVEDLAGNVVAPAVRGGRAVGVRAVVKAVAAAVEKGALPEPVVWEAPALKGDGPVSRSNPAAIRRDFEERIEPASEETAYSSEIEKTAASMEPNPASAPEISPAGGPETAAPEGRPVLKDFLAAARRVVAVFRAVDEADSAAVASGLAEACGALHVEVAQEPRACDLYGESLEAALNSGCYAFSDGGEVRGARPDPDRVLVVEVDPNVQARAALDYVYGRAGKVVHVVGHDFNGVEKSKRNVRLWLDNGWRLDALVVDRVPDASHVVEIFKGTFGSEVGLICGVEGKESFAPLAQELLKEGN